MIRMFPLVVTGLLLLSGCASTQFTNLWHEPDYQGPKLKKMLVLGLFGNDTQRRAFEQGFVDRINAKGLQAVASYRIAPNPGDLDSKDKVKAALDRVGADSLLITTFHGIKKEERYVPPSVDYVPSLRGYGYYGFYGPAYTAVYSPGYTRIDTKARLETRVYALHREQLVWASETESVNAKSADKVIRELADLVLADLQKNGLID